MGSADETSRFRRVTYRQLEAMWELLNSNRQLAVGFNKTAQAREFSKRMWQNIAGTLNSEGEGAIKTPKGWSNYWIDYKAKLKKRVAAIRISSTRTGGGAPDVPPLNDLEKKFLGLLGENYGAGLPNTQVPLFPTLTETLDSGDGEVTISIDCDIEADEQLQSPLSRPQPQPQLQTQTQPQPQTQTQPQPQTQTQPQPQTQTQPQSQSPTSPQPTISQDTTSRPLRRRRQRRPVDYITQDEARRNFVDISRIRLDIDRRNNELFERMALTLSSIDNRLETLGTLMQVLIDRIGPDRNV